MTRTASKLTLTLAAFAIVIGAGFAAQATTGVDENILPYSQVNESVLPYAGDVDENILPFSDEGFDDSHLPFSDDGANINTLP